MIIFKRLFYFLGSIYFAIFLISLSAIFVAAGTFIESSTGSHFFAARWTYENSAFLFLLSLFFINILFSALRRWPFKKRHVPFLITHIGLLMIISGTMIKNRWGLQGQLSVWEGSGNQHVLLPHTYAVQIEEKGLSPLHKFSLISFDSFSPQQIHYPFHFPHLKCKLMSYAPHVTDVFETWIKNTNAYIAGFPRLPVHQWEPSQAFPKGTLHLSTIDSRVWQIFALRTPHVEKALQLAYVQEAMLQIESKKERSSFQKISLEEALLKPFSFAGSKVEASLHLSSKESEAPFLNLEWSPSESNRQTLTLPLRGQEALMIKNTTSDWLEPSFIIDLDRPYHTLCIIQDEQENVFLAAFDLYGRFHIENFNPQELKSLISYDQGFGGYSVQTRIPFPTFPTGRKDKEKAETHGLTARLREALLSSASLTPPLQHFKKACQELGIDTAHTFVQFLTEWHAAPGLIFHPNHPLPDSLEKVLNRFDWNSVPSYDRQAIQWIDHLLTQLTVSSEQGEDPFKILEKHHWPLLAEFKKGKTSPSNLLAQQVCSILSYLPPLEAVVPISLHEKASLLSAYFRMFDIDYHSLLPSQHSDKEQFNELESYWKETLSEEKEMKQEVVFETPLTHHVVPDAMPIKLEDQRPGLILEFQQGESQQAIVLAYDQLATGLKWPILDGRYLIRFQPQQEKIPYRVRLREARQIFYPQSSQVYSYESDLWLTEENQLPTAQTLSMNHVYETWDGYRFYLSGVGTSADSTIKHIQLAVNYDPAKYFLTYPGAFLVFVGTFLLFWGYQSRYE